MISDISDLEEWQQKLVITAITQCDDLVEKNNLTVKEAISQIIPMYSALFPDKERLEDIIYKEVTQPGNRGVSIISPEYRNEHWWNDYKEKNLKDLDYWTRYELFLKSKPGWSSTSVSELDCSIDDLLNHLANPNSKEKDERIGLVYGDVQSGKTAHYIGLINKAYSAGYKIIIVLSGIHNSLRSQTQTRVDEEVLGYKTSSNEDSDSQKRNSIGVGLVKGFNVVPLTSVTNRDEKGDFNVKLSQGYIAPPHIIITKKVGKILTTLTDWYQKGPLATVENGRKVIGPEYPALIIDDEADQASINTNNPNKSEDPSKINGYIRQLLNTFQCRSYVGYTATPFANIFIPKNSKNERYGDDLFPRDFLIKAPRPAMYIGAKEFFGIGDEDISMPLTRTIISKYGSDFGHRIKDNNGDSFKGNELPSELDEALKSFYIAVAVRNIRGHINKPNSMLVHVVRYTDEQKVVRTYLESAKNNLENLIKYNDSEIKEIFNNLYLEDFKKTNKKMRSLFSFYSQDCDFIPFDEVWSEIKNIVSKTEQKIKILCINGKSNDALVYKNHEGKPFNVIVVGGDKLSRGLTLEGLSISYFTRISNSLIMDTLLQMGRWFGYRKGYIDVCRIYSTPFLLNKFKEISYSVANLSQQFDEIDILNTNPSNFGLKVATNPDILISSRNKIRTGQEFKSDFSCKLVQTRILDTDPEIILSNYKAVDSFLLSIEKNRVKPGDYKGCKIPAAQKENGKTFWIGVNGSLVADFFENYHTSKHATRASAKYIAEYIRELNHHGGLIDWTICLNGLSRSDNKEYISKIANNTITVNGIYRNIKTESDEDKCDLGAIVSHDDTELDFTVEQKERANLIREREREKEKEIANNIKSCEPEHLKKQIVSRIIRKEVRDFCHGFLILYPIGQAQSNLKTENGIAPYGFAVVFPDRQNKGNLKNYRFNDVAMEELDYEE